jgi:hypothetical protein
MHASCLCAWLEQSRAGKLTCPLCRAALDVPAQPQPARQRSWLQRARRATAAQQAPAQGGKRQEQRCCCDGAAPAPVAMQQQHPVGAAATGSPGTLSRPFTRLQARLAADSAAASSAAAAGPAARRGSRGPRRIDGMLG